MGDSGTGHSYAIVCHCGCEICVASSQAGTVVRCSRCGAAIDLPSLSHLRRLPIVAGLSDKRGSQPLTLMEVGGRIISVFCGAVLAILFFLSLLVLGWKGTLMLCAIAGCAALVAVCWPQPVKYVAVLGAIFFLSCTLIFCFVARSRDQARRNQITYNLKEIGVGMGHAHNYFRNQEPSDTQSWLAENDARRINVAKPK